MDRLATCHPDIQDVIEEVERRIPFDFTVLCGHRGREAQERAFDEGNSKARWGQSPHNKKPSDGIDVAPYPIDWNDTEAFTLLATYVLAVAAEKGIPLRWGGHFRSIKDLPHFERGD